MTTFVSSQTRKGSYLCLTPLLTIILTGYTSMSQAQEFGNLFTSPEEREYLDYLREDFVTRSQLATFNIQEDVIPDIPESEAVVEVEAEIINYKFGGVMTRINGNRMVWLNGKQVAEGSLPGNFSLLNTAAGIQININANGRSYQLKPGQTINMQSGVISDSYENTENPASTSNNPASANSNSTLAETGELISALQTQSSEGQTDNAEIDEEGDILGSMLQQANLNTETLDDEQQQQVINMLLEQSAAEQ